MDSYMFYFSEEDLFKSATIAHKTNQDIVNDEQLVELKHLLFDEFFKNEGNMKYIFG